MSKLNDGLCFIDVHLRTGGNFVLPMSMYDTLEKAMKQWVAPFDSNNNFFGEPSLEGEDTLISCRDLYGARCAFYASDIKFFSESTPTARLNCVEFNKAMEDEQKEVMEKIYGHNREGF